MTGFGGKEFLEQLAAPNPAWAGIRPSFKNRASNMPRINRYLRVFHEARSVTGRRILQGMEQTRSLLSGSVKQPSPNLTSLVPEKCPRNTTQKSEPPWTQAGPGRAARFQPRSHRSGLLSSQAPSLHHRGRAPTPRGQTAACVATRACPGHIL